MQALRQLLGLLAQLVLLARQPFELSLQLLRVESFAIPLQVTLLAIERILTPRELPNAFQRIVLPVLLPCLGRILERSASERLAPPPPPACCDRVTCRRRISACALSS